MSNNNNNKRTGTLRNFKLNDNLFYEYEWIATFNMRNVTAQLTEDIKAIVEKFKKENPQFVNTDGTLPLIEKRRIQVDLENDLAQAEKDINLQLKG